MRYVLYALLSCALLAGCATREQAAPETGSRPSVWAARPLSWASLAQLDWPEPQSKYNGYGAPVRNAMWGRVYRSGGEELYCRERFTGIEASARLLNGEQLQLEHVFPADSMADQFGFDDRDCETPNRSDSDEAGCKAATGDMHNLLAAYGRINGSRSNHPYGELPDIEGTNNPNYTELCPDFERASVEGQVYVEPDDEAQGDIARALIYMHFVYDLDLGVVIDDPDRLLEWTTDDPVTETERRRERRVREEQPGSWNPLILPPPAQVIS